MLAVGLPTGGDAYLAVLRALNVVASRVTGVVQNGSLPVYTGVINLGGIVHTDLPSTGSAMHMIFGRRGSSDMRCDPLVRRTGSATSPGRTSHRVASC